MSRKLKLFFSIALCSIPIIIYFYFVFHYAVNIPYSDDFGALLDFLKQYISAPTLQQKLSLLFTQWNEHRIVSEKLITLGQFYFFGRINFTILTFCGNMGLLIIAGVFYYEFKRLNLSLVYFTPIPFVLFNLMPYENVVWALSAMQANFVITFAVLSFYYATYYLNKKEWSFSFLSCFASAFTSGNGIFSALTISSTKLLTKQYKRCLYFFILSLVIIACFFYHYQHQSKAEIPLAGIQVLKGLSTFFLVFIGSFAQGLPWISRFLSVEHLTIVVALFILITFLWLLFRKKISNHEFLFSIFTFICLTGVVVTLSRYQMGIIQAQVPRYRIYSLLLITSIYLMFLKEFTLHKKTIFLVFFTLFVATYIHSYNQNIGLYKFLKSEREKSMHMFCSQNNATAFTPNTAVIKSYLQSAITKNIYTPCG